MREIEYCMRYAENCNRCPLNRICEQEYQKEMEQRSGGVSENEHNNRSKIWKMDGSRKGRKQKKSNGVEMPL